MQSKAKISGEQLARLIAKKKSESKAPVTSPQLSAQSSGFPLSSAQARVLLVGEDEEKKRAAYSGFALLLHGPLQLSALRAAWQDVLNLHEVLRSTYAFDAALGQIGQTVLPSAEAAFEVENLPVGASDAELEANLARIHENLNFDLSRAQVAKAYLLQADAQRSMLFMAIHHIAFDGWSRQVLIDDLGRFYQAHCAGQVLVPPTRKTYRAWASEERASGYAASAQQYWQQQLQGLQENDVFHLLRRAQPQTEKSAVQRLVFQIDAALTQRVKNLAEQYGATQYALLLTVYKLLLARFTLETDICVGSPVANRAQAELENIVGCFVNSVAIRSSMNLQHSFVQLLKHEQGQVLDALEHQSMPFDAVVRSLIQGQRSTISPLFQAFFVLQNPTVCDGRFGPSLQAQLRPMADDTALFDMTLNIEVLGQGMQAELMVAAEIGQAERWAEHFLHLLACVTEAPQAPLTSLALLPANEREQLVHLADSRSNADAVLPETLVALGGAVQSLADCSCYLLDAQGNQVPLGAPGLLFVGGATLSNVDVNEPSHIGLRSVTDRFSAKPQAALYNTGELAYLAADGKLRSLGRANSQRQAAALHSATLPEVAAVDVPSDTPNSPTEQVLVDLFARMLKVEGVNRHSRFFDLGGHSLLALEIIGKMAATYGIRLSARNFFANCPIATIALEIDQLRGLAASPARDLAHHTAPQAAVTLSSAPLSAEQSALWWLMQMSADAGHAYNIPFTLHFETSETAAEITQAVSMVLAQHAVLRIRIRPDSTSESGNAEQYLVDDGQLHIPQFDFTHLPAAAAVEAQAQLQQRMAQHSFALQSEAPIRFALVLHADAHWALVVVVHHLVFDGGSKPVFINAIASALGSIRAGKAASAAASDDGYFHYAQAQRALLQAPTLSSTLKYWQTRLQALPPPLSLNTVKTRPALQSWQGRTVSLQWGLAESERLKNLAKQYGTSDFVVILALVKAFLARVSRSQDIVVGTPASTRVEAAYANTIGYFVNMLASRSQIDEQQSFADLLGQETASFYADLQQALPFDVVLNALKLPRDASRTPIFQICVSHHPASQTSSALRLEDLALQQSKFDLSIDIASSAQAASPTHVSFNYNTDVFQEDEVLALLHALHAFGKDVSAAPNAPLASAGLLSDAQQAIWTAMNQTHAPIKWPSVPLALAAVAQQNPQGLALIDDEVALSFSDLIAWIGALGQRLLQAGLQPGEHVVVLCDRNAELIAASLAVLCVGGVYVPADPANPPARINEIAQHCAARFFMCREEDAPRCPPTVETLVVQRTFAAPEAFWQLPALQAPALPATDTAYVMYTSGSTGKPKGVAISHAGILRLASDAKELVFERDARMAQATSCAFDVSVWEIDCALLNGVALVMIPKPVLLSAEVLRERLHQQAVTHMFVTPTLAKNLQDECPTVFRALRELWLGGEAVSLELAENLLQAYPQLRLVNGYGPTECTVFAATKLITPQTIASGVIPIGAPYSNTTAYVLDEQRRLLPPYMEGEIYLGGPGLAQAYVQQAEMTAEKFVANPFARSTELDEQRLYRTGDRGRLTKHGEIEYLGRIDKQVKIRGYRIEPGEVEIALSRLPGVRQAHVAARPNPAGENQLCAWLIVSQADLSSAKVNAFLREQLPAFLIPQHILFVEHFPTTSSGKLASNALPLPTFEHPAKPIFLSDMVGKLHEAEAATVAGQIRQIWQRLLGHDEFGLHSGFFEVGGNSLLAMRLKTALSDCFKLDITVVDCFKFPDIDSMSKHVEAKSAGVPDTGSASNEDDELALPSSRRRAEAGRATRRETQRVREEF